MLQWFLISLALLASSTRWRLVVLSILTLALLTGATRPVLGEDATTADRNSGIATSLSPDELAWAELPSIAECPPVRIWSSGPRMEDSDETFVITHGMGGTVPGDRFHQLAAAIRQRWPHAAILLIDWSQKASAKIGGFPNPFKVAGSIDEVGDQVALMLKHESINPAHTTFIGESFGNWVNARIARGLGGVQGIVALNPANELGGYLPPDLRKHANHSSSFHTYSVFDTTLEIAELDFWLETPAGATDGAQHITGICWLAARLNANDISWLNMDQPLPPRHEGCFRASVTMDGRLLNVQPARSRPARAEFLPSRSDRLATDLAVAP